MGTQPGVPYGTPQIHAGMSPAQLGPGQLTSASPVLTGGKPVGSTKHRLSPPDVSVEGHGQSTAISEGPKSLTRSQATMEDMLDSSEDKTSNNDPDECSSDDKSLEDTPVNPEAEKDFDLETTMNMLRQVNLVITRDDTLKKKEETENLTAVLCFLDRGLSTPRVQEWAEAALIRSKKLKILSITAIGSKNYHIRFQSQKNMDRALSRTRITYLDLDFNIVKWSLEAEDLSYFPALYPVWARFTSLTQLQLFWIKEIAGTLSPVLIGDPNGSALGQAPSNLKWHLKCTLTTTKENGELTIRRPSLPPLPTSKFFQQPRTKSRSDGYWRKVTPQQTALIDKEVDQAANGNSVEGTKIASEENRAKKHRGESSQERAPAPLQAETETAPQEALSTQESGTIEMFCEKKREGTTAQRTRIALVSESLQSKSKKDAANKQNTSTTSPPTRKNRSRHPQDKLTPPVSPLVPKQLLGVLAQRDSTEQVELPSEQEQKGAEEPAANQAHWEEKVQGQQLEAPTLTEGIRAKFPRKQAASQGHSAALGGKTLSMKTSAIQKREMRAAKAAARAASGVH
ncbi:hypothetical protein AXG93_402s1010 [Marchantia polymorpha subsp. ruderalis]|uniref:DUF4283 domain-containing protein n=1 Tax=Marchantia polymorpha subsp. ruderalis TaxID=1480154 RepID=A0A176WBV6_MARPO|nr:hypothetical protein AXG93_402s1010 [Marchantia polymorpha subsp. ruderalis]